MLLPLHLVLPLMQGRLQLTVGHTQCICLCFQTLAAMLQTSDILDQPLCIFIFFRSLQRELEVTSAATLLFSLSVAWRVVIITLRDVCSLHGHQWSASHMTTTAVRHPAVLLGKCTSDLSLGDKTRLDCLLVLPSLAAFFSAATWPQTPRM